MAAPDEKRVPAKRGLSGMADFERTRQLFHMPEGVIYLDGNSLGPLPLSARERVSRMMQDEWGEMLIRGWNQANWMTMPRRVGDRVGRLIGARRAVS